ELDGGGGALPDRPAPRRRAAPRHRATGGPPLVRLDAPRTQRPRRPREGPSAPHRSARDVPPPRHAQARRARGGAPRPGARRLIRLVPRSSYLAPRWSYLLPLPLPSFFHLPSSPLATLVYP